MKGLTLAAILVLLATGCANSEQVEGPFSECIVYEADGMMYMECPLASLVRHTPDRTPHKDTPLDRVLKPLRACPVSQCHEDFCWNLCDTQRDLCIYNARPEDRPKVPGRFQKSDPNTQLIN